MVDQTSYMFVTANVVKTVTNEDVTSDELGGARRIQLNQAFLTWWLIMI